MAEELKTSDPELTPIHILSQAFKDDAAEDQRLAASNLINEKAQQDKTGDLTTGTQWAPLVFSILGRNYEGALEAWNGGRKTYADAFGPEGSRYKQERNSRGATGVLFDTEGKQLTPEQMAEVTKKGWVVSKEDMTAAGLGQFRATNEGVLAMRKAPYEQVVGAYKKASEQAVASSGIANQWAEMEKIAARSRNKDGVSWLDIYNKLSPQERAKLSAAASVQTQSATGASKEAGTSAGQSAGNQATVGQTRGAEVSGGIGGKGVVPPGSAGGVGVAPNVGGGVSGSNTSSSSAQVGATSGATTSAGTTASSGVQQQAQFRDIVESIFQGKMSDSEFTDFQRFIQLNDSLNAIQAKRGGEGLAPGSENLGQLDPLLSGQKNTAITAYKGMQNEALLSEWNHFLADKMNSSARMPSQAELAKEFEDSEVYKAIKYRYGSNIEQVRSGKAHEPKDGDVSVNNKNQLIVYSNGKWKDKK